MGGEVHEGQTRNLYEIAGNRKGVRRRRNRKGKGRNTSKVEAEMKWGEGERKKTDERKKGEESYQDSRRKNIQQGDLPENSVGEWNGLG
jgi:hypothetical protein